MMQHGASLRVVVMGVSGAGKTTVGALLARRLKLPYADGDSLHAPASIAKMAAGMPLTDADRAPWLAAIGAFLRAHTDSGAVVSCSALRRSYRATLEAASPHLVFLHLHGNPETVRARVAQRARHFMPVSLVDSQLATLEPLGADERGLVVDLARAPSEIVDELLRYLRADR